MLEGRIGARALTGIGSAVLGAAGFLLAGFHDSAWQIVVSMTLIGIGVGPVYAMLAKLIVDAVAREVTGVAMGMNTVMRTIGGVIGGQVGAALLSAVTIPGTPDIPSEDAFTTMFLLAGLAALAGALATLRIPGRRAMAASRGAAEAGRVPAGAARD